MFIVKKSLSCSKSANASSTETKSPGMEWDGKINMTPAGAWVFLSKDRDSSSPMTNLSFIMCVHSISWCSLQFLMRMWWVSLVTDSSHITNKQSSRKKQKAFEFRPAATTIVHTFSCTWRLFQYNYPFYGCSITLIMVVLEWPHLQPTILFNCWLFTSYFHKVTGSLCFTQQTKTKYNEK